MVDETVLIDIAARVLEDSDMGSVGLYTLDEERNVESGIVRGMPRRFTPAYEKHGMPIDPVLEALLDTGKPVSTRTLLGSGWEDCELYHRVSRHFGLTGFAALPIYECSRLRAVLYFGSFDKRPEERLEGQGLCDLMIYSGQIGTELSRAPFAKRPRLTARQVQVAALVARGGTNKQIARELSTGLSAVNKHMKALHLAFGVHTRTELARAWINSE